MSRPMKFSGVEWIGMIPENWEVVKVKHIFKISRGRVIAQTDLEEDGIYPVFSAQTKDNGCIGYLNTYDFNIDQLTWTTDGNAGYIFLRSGKHNCTNVCGTLQLINTINSDLRFFKYALNYFTIFYKRVDINGFKIMNNEMAEVITTISPFSTQQQIADFLDKKCAAIDKTIELKESSIEKLKEYKQSLIYEAVTKGLDPNVPMKDSGIEWIGMIPEDWEVVKLKFLGTLSANGVDKKIHEGEDLYKSVHYMDVYKNSLKEINNKSNYLIVSASKNKIEACSLKKGDVIFTTSSESPDDIGHSVVVLEDLIQTLLGYHLIRFRPKKCFSLYFEKYLFGYLGLRYWFALRAYGMTRYGLSYLDFLNAPTILAPFSTQQQIADFLDKKCAAIDKTIELKESSIEKLKEYKQSLIYEAVTGKIEV